MNFLRKKQPKKTSIVPFSEFSSGREKWVLPERRVVRPSLVLFLVPWGVFLFTLVFVLFFSEETKITDIVFSGHDHVSVTDLEHIVRGDMEGKYFRVFSRNNFFFLPTKNIISDIENLSPEIRSVRVERIFPRGLSVRIDERTPVIVWRSANGDFILNEDGVARTHPSIDSVLGNPFTVILWDEEGRETTSGDTVVDASLDMSLLEYMQKFESRFGKRIDPNVRMTSRFSGELLFHVEGGFDMMIDSHQPIDETLGTLQAALDRGIPESDQERLARIDLRTANKVYYTVKGE